MRTTIDIPDSLFREIKATAAVQGRTLKDWILGAVRSELQGTEKRKPSRRIKLPIVESKEVSYDVSADRIAEILEEEEYELPS